MRSSGSWLSTSKSSWRPGMTTSVKDERRRRRAYVPTTALAQAVEFTEDMLHVQLTDGRVVSAPLTWFPTLYGATPEERARYRIGAGGRGLHWPDLDEDLSVAGLMAGADEQAA